MKKLFCVTAMNHDDHHKVTYNNVYDINHVWDVEHDSLRLLIWTGMDSTTARREFINMNENDILIVREGT